MFVMLISGEKSSTKNEKIRKYNNKMVSFVNKSSNEVIISYWVSRGINTMIDRIVKIDEEIDVSDCIVDEWIIMTTSYSRIGKFTNEPCASGNYSWLETYDFELEFDPSSQKGILTSNF